MADIALVWDAQDLRADYALTATDIAIGSELASAVMVSLFTEPGWWANAFEDDAWGCRLSELFRAKRSQQTRQRARDYCQLALAWLVEDGVADSVDVQTEWQGTALLIGIAIAQATGVSRFNFVWSGV